MRIVCISDTHGQHGQLRIPDGDILVCTGDFTKRGRPGEVRDFNEWLATQPHQYKVIIAGNHDFLFEQQQDARTLLSCAIYLQDEACVLQGLKIYGSPWQPRFFNWAFNADRGEPLRQIWSRIPIGIDVLLTHGPPHGILDVTARGQVVGCEELSAALRRVRPRLHVFGHIHESYGQLIRDGTHYVNASSCNLQYVPIHPPIVVDL
ncbi:MAG: metallophosphatase domain-containing protein [Myxococcales bacterium]|nr:metallophosphatase domain-containing protein [Myxococcales bacterium]